MGVNKIIKIMYFTIVIHKNILVFYSVDIRYKLLTLTFLKRTVYKYSTFHLIERGHINCTNDKCLYTQFGY